jgi:hypothetical protein
MSLYRAGPHYGGMMGGYYGTGGYGGWFYLLAAVGLVSGVIILLGSVMLYSRPGKAQTWGALILTFSVVSFFGMGGFLLGAILGIVGGVLALTWHPQATVASA